MYPWKICAGLLTAVLVASPGWTADEEEEEPKLLGRCTAQQLGEDPFAEWFDEGYGDYSPNPEVGDKLRDALQPDISFTVFFGTWCPDSQREVPRLVKLLDTLEFPAKRLTLVAVDYLDDTHKQSPGGEEQGLEVYRVPAIVVSRDGQEIGRFVEHPVLSLERDLLAILSGELYAPDYASYPIVHGWLQDGLLGDENVSHRGLAGQLRQVVATEGELAAAGRTLLARGDIAEGVKLLRANCVLYPESSRCFARLADGLHRLGEQEEAREMVEKALRLNTDPAQVEDLVKLVEKTGQLAD